MTVVNTHELIRLPYATTSQRVYCYDVVANPNTMTSHKSVVFLGHLQYLMPYRLVSLARGMNLITALHAMNVMHTMLCHAMIQI